MARKGGAQMGRRSLFFQKDVPWAIKTPESKKNKTSNWSGAVRWGGWARYVWHSETTNDRSISSLVST